MVNVNVRLIKRSLCVKCPREHLHTQLHGVRGNPVSSEKHLFANVYITEDFSTVMDDAVEFKCKFSSKSSLTRLFHRNHLKEKTNYKTNQTGSSVRIKEMTPYKAERVGVCV